jgi:hypothetical protein
MTDWQIAGSVGVAVIVGVDVLAAGGGVDVAVGVRVTVPVAAAVPVGVAVFGSVAVAVPVAVPSGVFVAVRVLVAPGGLVCVAVLVAAAVCTTVAVCVASGVPGTTQPLVHASQQLVQPLTVALPPFGARHFAALFFTVHLVLPRAVVRQQVTEPGRPQVAFFAHFFTAPAQALDSSPSVRACAITAFAQRT